MCCRLLFLFHAPHLHGVIYYSCHPLPFRQCFVHVGRPELGGGVRSDTIVVRRGIMSVWATSGHAPMPLFHLLAFLVVSAGRVHRECAAGTLVSLMEWEDGPIKQRVVAVGRLYWLIACNSHPITLALVPWLRIYATKWDLDISFSVIL
jgi:hypothetical protein